MEKSPWLVRVGRGGGVCTPTSFHSTITYKVAVDTPAERADTLPLFHLYPYMYSVGITRTPFGVQWVSVWVWKKRAADSVISYWTFERICVLYMVGLKTPSIRCSAKDMCPLTNLYSVIFCSSKRTLTPCIYSVRVAIRMPIKKVMKCCLM